MADKKKNLLNKTLIDAIKKNEFANAKIALEIGADANAQDENGISGIMFALAFKNKKTFKLLLDYGANVNITIDGENLIDFLNKHAKEYKEFLDLAQSVVKKKITEEEIIKKFPNLKRIEITDQFFIEGIENPDAMNKTLFNEEESITGLCAILLTCKEENEYTIAITNSNKEMFLFNAEIIKHLEIKSGFCEFVLEDNKQVICAGSEKFLPIALKPYFELVFADPFKITTIPEETFIKYFEAFEYVTANSFMTKIINLKQKLDNLKEEDSISERLDLKIDIQQNIHTNKEFKKLLSSLESKYLKHNKATTNEPVVEK